MGGTLRTVRQETREYLLARIKNCVEMTAEMFRAKAELKIPASVSALTVDEACADIVGKGFAETLGRQPSVSIRRPPAQRILLR